MRTRHLQLVTREHSVTVTKTSTAYSPFGPVRAGLITTRPTNEAVQLTELLNCLERKITEANIKSLEVLNTYLNDTEHPAKQTVSFPNTDTING